MAETTSEVAARRNLPVMVRLHLPIALLSNDQHQQTVTADVLNPQISVEAPDLLHSIVRCDMSSIEIDGEKYNVEENLGFQPSAGVYAKQVRTKEGPRIAVKPRGGKIWRFWTVRDRVAPLKGYRGFRT